MHSHIHALGLNVVNPYTVRTLEKTDAAQRAAEVRKKLVEAGGEIEVASEAESDWLVGRGYEGASQRGARRQTYPGKKEGAAAEAGEFIEAISVWA